MYKKSSRGILKHIDFLLLDVLCLFIAFVISLFIRFGNEASNYLSNSTYINMLYVLLLSDVVILVLLDTLQNVLKHKLSQDIYVTVRQAIVLAFVGSFYLFSTKTAETYSRLSFIYMCLIYLVLTFCVRQLWKHFLIHRIHRRKSRKLLVITTSDMEKEIVAKSKEYAFQLYTFDKVILSDIEHFESKWEDIDVVGYGDDAAEIIGREWIDEVLVNVPATANYPNGLVNQCVLAGLTVHSCLSRTSQIEGRKQFVDRVGTYDVVTTASNYFTPKQIIWKRFIDILGGIVGCFITLLICIFVGPIIYISSPGPLFFKQERIGLNGKKFKIYKFRSMYMDAEERKKELMAKNRIEDGLMFKMDFDPRIIGNKELPDGTRKTGIGQFIRNTSLDEFPQFINVLKGDMSIVGTRPPTVDEWEKYDLHHRSRLAIKPGITGMWQVSGRSKITDFEEVVRLDNEYISHWDIWLDFKIIFKTIKVVFERDGSM